MRLRISMSARIGIVSIIIAEVSEAAEDAEATAAAAAAVAEAALLPAAKTRPQQSSTFAG